MKTITGFRREAAAGGLSLEIVEWYGKTGEDIPERLRGIRKVSKVKSDSIILTDNQGRESWLSTKHAKLFEYYSDNLYVYKMAQRGLSVEEKRTLDRWDRIEKEYYEKNPYGNSYWKKKDFFSKSTCPWMSGFDCVKGKSYDKNTNLVYDPRYRGDLIIKYKIHRTEETE